MQNAEAEYKKVTDVEKKQVVELGGLHVVGTERHVCISPCPAGLHRLAAVCTPGQAVSALLAGGAVIMWQESPSVGLVLFYCML